MTNMIWDPMIYWPKTPTLLPSVQYFINDGIIIYGGVKGPFKLKGEKSVQLTLQLFNILQQNNKPFKQFIDELHVSKEIGNELLYLLSILHQNGCLDSLEPQLKNAQYYSKLNQSTNNYKSVEEIESYKKSIDLKLSINDSLVTKDLNNLFELNGFQVTQNNIATWELKEVKDLADIEFVDENNKTLLFCRTKDGLIIGPVISRDAISRQQAKQLYKELDFLTDYKAQDCQLLYMIAMKFILKLAEYNFNRGMYIFSDNHTTFKSLMEMNENLSLLEKFELATAFSAGHYSHKKGHFLHYRASNLKLARKEVNGEFWLEYDGEIPEDIHGLLVALSGFKKSDPRKKNTPTGGNINSNRLFYLNFNPNKLNGIGIYLYNNVKDNMFQISNSIEQIKKCFIENLDGFEGIILIGSDVDIIAEKYREFGFKVANLNSGVVLATLVALKHTLFANSELLFMNSFDEKNITKALGVNMSNIIINQGVGIKNYD